ncbi:hypothetical protein [Pukyongiella litopenaei]|uniref:Uncharacterized protein n=1 Tax=Pukyongiella litopenaei TaxID=2605946 RepID=A0A2S0MMU7_9RHOB|nr:hypothetical protein [Pukyongiella litopenaei]AVO37204.1 hypothetical protein C6Y53_05430 [Pukyongiella litopenaei]
MGLATAIRDAKPDELEKLGAFLIGEFRMQAANPVTDESAKVASTDIVSALGAWAYMQLNAQDVGD